MPSILFFIFAGVAIFAASLVVLVKNPVKAVLSLILCFIATAGTWLILDAEFLAWALILVYVGAVMVLFLFVVMMLDVKFALERASLRLPVGVALTLGLVYLLKTVIYSDGFILNKYIKVLAYGPDNVNNTELIGNLVFTKYLPQFEIAGVILLVAIIAAIALVYRGPQNRKQQKISSQLAASPENRLRLVDGN